mgnify:CR=1 FL=1
MKITKAQLLKLISEERTQIDESILLEAPDVPDAAYQRQAVPIVGQEQEGDYTKDPAGYEGEMAKRSLFHMAAQAQQLHDMLKNDQDLEPWVQDKITKAADYMEAAFKAITYDKQNPEGR